MNTKSRSTLLMLVLLLTLTAGVTRAQGPEEPQTPTAVEIMGGSATYSFTYQGTLEEDGAPANGEYDFLFSLWDSSAPTANLIDTLTSPTSLVNYPVEDGFFSFHLMPASLSFHEAFDGGERWIQVQVRSETAAIYTTLPRQPIAAVPYAWSLRPGAVITGTIPNRSTLYVGNAYDTGTIGSALTAENHADTSPTIYAYHHGTGHALYGRTASGYPAVEGENDADGTGVLGESAAGIGVYGQTGGTNSYGVVGVQSGYSTSDQSSYWKPGGFFAGDNGLMGLSKDPSGFAVIGWNKAPSGASSYGIFGRSESPDTWTGYFYATQGNGVYANVSSGKVGFNTDGLKSAVVAASDGARLLYTEESTEVWFTDYGSGTLQDGKATVTIDTTFAETVNLDEPYHVFVEPYGPAALYVADRTPTSFVVRAQEGDPDVEFSYRLVAKRLGYEKHRLERAPWADHDPHLYPEQSKSMQQPLEGGE